MIEIEVTKFQVLRKTSSKFCKIHFLNTYTKNGQILSSKTFISHNSFWNEIEKLKTVTKNLEQWQKTQNSGGKNKMVAKFFFATYVFRKISYSMSSES